MIATGWNRSVRVVLVSREYPPVIGGGIGTYTATLARALARAGHRVSVIARGASGAAPESGADGIRVYRIPQPTTRGLGRSRRAGNGMTCAQAYQYSRAVAAMMHNVMAADGVDVIQSPEHGAEGFVLATNGIRAPHVVRFHTPLYLVNQAVGRQLSLGGRIVDLMERTVARRAVLNTCASRALAGIVAHRFGIPTDRIRVVPNAVDHELFAPGRRGVGPPLTVLYVGKVAPLKGAADLAEAIPRVLQRVPQARFQIVGSDHPGAHTRSTRGEMMARLQQAGVASRVTFLPPTPRRDLVGLYQAADLCVLPTRWDNFPNTCLEAMACGVPVVASAVGGLPEIIADGDNGVLVPPGDPMRLADGIVGLLEHADRRLAMGQAARERIVARYTMDRIAAQTAAVYEEAIRRFAGQRGGRRAR